MGCNLVRFPERKSPSRTQFLWGRLQVSSPTGQLPPHRLPPPPSAACRLMHLSSPRVARWSPRSQRCPAAPCPSFPVNPHVPWRKWPPTWMPQLKSSCPRWWIRWTRAGRRKLGKSPWKPEVQTWNDRKWAQHETHRYDEGEYMKGEPKGKGWGKGKGKMNNGKGQNWNTNNNTTWKGSNNRGMSAQYSQHGQHNTQHNSQHNSQHNGHHRRPNEWNDWEEHWDDWEEKEWSDEAWRSQWRGAEPNKPNKWAQDPGLPRRKTSPDSPRPWFSYVFLSDSFPKDHKPWFGIGSRGSKTVCVCVCPTISDLHRKLQWLF